MQINQADGDVLAGPSDSHAEYFSPFFTATLGTATGFRLSTRVNVGVVTCARGGGGGAIEVTLPPEGPVFDLPPGYTACSPEHRIVNNRWLGDGTGCCQDDACCVDPGPLADFDGDGLVCPDNCPFDANADQADADGDGLGDACDADVYNLIVTAETSQQLLDSIAALEGSLVTTDAAGRTALIMNLLDTVGVNYTVTGNGDLELLQTPGLVSVGGELRIENNPMLGSVSLPALTQVGGCVAISGNTSATEVDLGGTTVGGNVVVSGNGSTAGGMTAIDLGGTTVGGNVVVSGNGSTAGGTTIDLGGSTIDGDLIMETHGQGTVDLSTTVVNGDMTVTSTDATTILADTAAGTSSVTLINAWAELFVTVPQGTYQHSGVPFSITRQDPTTLPPAPGHDAGGGNVMIDPFCAYAFSFAEVPTLGQHVTLTFEVDLELLDDATRLYLVQAMNFGRATLAVKSDAAGSVYEAIPICMGGQTPAADGCAAVSCCDPLGCYSATTVCPLADPTRLRFSGMASHFSSWAVVVASAVPGACSGVNGCSGNGVCVGTNQCDCFAGWTGEDCSVDVGSPAGRVPSSAPDVPLTLAKNGAALDLQWGASCTASDTDYEVYEGILGDFDSHAWVTCTTGGALTYTLTPGAGDHYYLVVPRNDGREGSYGRDSQNFERPAGTPSCVVQLLGGCP